MTGSGRLTRMLATLAALCAAGGAAAESWCDADRDPVFASLGRVPVSGGWFEAYAVAPGVFAIHEPRQYEGVTSFLVVGTRRAVLFDSGLGVGQIGDVVRKLTDLQVTVHNSHTHFDHVGGNREFDDVRNLDLPFSRASARGEVGDALRDYAGEVYLWAPETDVAEYGTSIARLVELAPRLERLLPAHGPPVAEPGQLVALDRALRDIAAGSVPFETTKSNRRLYKFDDFSILMNAKD